MRRLAFLAAASLAFIAISEPPSAEARHAPEKCQEEWTDCFTEYGIPYKCLKYPKGDKRNCKK